MVPLVPYILVSHKLDLNHPLNPKSNHWGQNLPPLFSTRPYRHNTTDFPTLGLDVQYHRNERTKERWVIVGLVWPFAVHQRQPETQKKHYWLSTKSFFEVCRRLLSFDYFCWLVTFTVTFTFVFVCTFKKDKYSVWKTNKKSHFLQELAIKKWLFKYSGLYDMQHLSS